MEGKSRGNDGRGERGGQIEIDIVIDIDIDIAITIVTTYWRRSLTETTKSFFLPRDPPYCTPYHFHRLLDFSLVCVAPSRRRELGGDIVHSSLRYESMYILQFMHELFHY